MNPAAPDPRGPSLARVTWLVAWAALCHAVLLRFAATNAWLTWGIVLFVVGAVASTSPVRLRGARSRLLEAGLGGLCLVALGLGLRLLVDALAGEDRPEGLLLLAPWIAVALIWLVDIRSLSRLWPLLRVEGFKVAHSRLFRWGLVSTFAVAVLAALTWERIPPTSGWTLASHTLGVGFFAAEVFALVLGATALSGEATGGTLKMMLPHAYRRSDWIGAKTLALLGACIVLGVTVVLVALGHAHLAEGLGDVTRIVDNSWQGGSATDVEVFPSGHAWMMRDHFADAALVALAALVVTGLIGVALSSIFDSVVASLCTAFLLFAGLKFADVLLRLPRETLQDIYAWYPEQLRVLTGKLGRAYNEGWQEALYPDGLRLALLTGVLALLFAIRAFARRDIHA